MTPEEELASISKQLVTMLRASQASADGVEQRLVTFFLQRVRAIEREGCIQDLQKLADEYDKGPASITYPAAPVYHAIDTLMARK